ncbi:NAD kinase [Candidatus Ecksteinia adelgidicola]|nr:NAD kinase [Candidatus Ecksteinia adelgidicola]
MNKKFTSIGIIGHFYNSLILKTYKTLYCWLLTHGYYVIIENKIAQTLKIKKAIIGDVNYIGQEADLAIVVGGDGNMLGAARILAYYDIKVIGINRGNLGFLTDLGPDNTLQYLKSILQGEYIDEQRFLLESIIYKGKKSYCIGTAINEVVLHSRKVAHMIEFEVYINDCFAFSQRSDGLIITTPTGSTAYSLSAGGPILSPSLDAIALVPMFSHTLSDRPLVINSNSIIQLKFLKNNIDLKISCDSQTSMSIQGDEKILIRRSDFYLNLIHPKHYDYFKTLSLKLGWSKKLF